MNTMEINWLEKNQVNYYRLNQIVKQNSNGIATKELVKIYNEEKTSKRNPMTIETFNYIIKTVKRAPNTFYNMLKINYSEKTERWVTNNESYMEEINSLKRENIRLKESLNNITTASEDW